MLPAVAAADLLARDGLNVTVVNCRFLKPYDEVTLAAILAEHRQILVVEEGTVVNGFGAYMASVIGRIDAAVRVHAHGVPDAFISRRRARVQLPVSGSTGGIADRVRAMREADAHDARPARADARRCHRTSGVRRPGFGRSCDAAL